MYKTEIDVEGAMRHLGNVSHTALPRAVGATLGRSATTTRAAAQRSIRESITLSAGVVRNAITITRVPRNLKPDQLYVDLRAKGGPLPLAAYQAKMTNRGATYRIARSQPRKVYKRKGRTGFMIGRRVASSSVKSRRVTRKFDPDPKFGGQVFTAQKAPGPDLPIRRAYGPGIAQRFNTRKVRRIIDQTFQESFRKRFPVELKFQLQRIEKQRSGRPRRA